ncbi:MAG: hypothetical protein KGV59_05865 [Tenacibaculum sp.]|nr:hypothetical protein [Tenacibaculum sp.]
MKIEDIVFDENYEMYFDTKNFGEICLTIADFLYACEEELKTEYKTKILDFITKIDEWHKIATDKIISYAKSEYEKDVCYKDIELINVFILFEQEEEGLFGLEFNVNFDQEHGCGLKIKAKEFEIIEIGEGDVAFC